MSYESATAPFSIGDKVWVPLSVGRTVGTIIEDRGRLGVSGERLFRVSIPHDPYDAEESVVSETEIERLSKHDEKELQQKLLPEQILDFLANGGLASILHRNSRDRVWLRLDPLGGVTYTFNEGYSTTGGQAPPLYVMYGEKIFEPEREQVIKFVESFGLTREQAQRVVRAIGTAP
jgi:hypothetical protein